ncbi:MAG: hypothetical protein IT276_10060 [Ignavibacteriaceae bacterium]|nr:hypothetical protein [Ignavibacterium sp.]MCC6255251.1 hypothetical protein [Ignavibacteriaceae bacterium]HMN23979.1 hypothetical protein [Ignavibacteriaceae bacterium]HRN26120.1 hypothetical protein [Ignavibacteriaceae bacterium]HRP92586.1 hypothetical protein [Ignavibacteriaceae bacterium]
MKPQFFLIIFVLFIYSCSEDPNENNQKLKVQTNKSSYQSNDSISFIINNSNSSTAHLASCCTSLAFYIDKNENGNWLEHSNFGLPCLAMCPGIDLTIRYMETITNSLSLNENGTYRIRIPYSFNSNYVFENELISNSFTVQ